MRRMRRNFVPTYHRRRNRKTPANKRVETEDGKTEDGKSKKTELPERHRFQVGSWNVEGKGTPEEIDKILTDAVKEPLDVVCLQKASLPSPNTETSNYKWICNGTSGSAILIKKSLDAETNSFEKISDDICVIELARKDQVKINVISCYIPPHTDYKCEEEWTKLKEVIGNISHMTFILAGDFNAQVGKEEIKSITTQEHLYHELSDENGKKLSNLIKKSHLMLYLSRRREKADNFTFNDGSLKCQRSYMFVPFSRHTFTSDDTIVRIPTYNHALLYYQINCRSHAKYGVKLGSDDGGSRHHPTMYASWNIQSSTPTKVDSVLNELGLPIVCIQELFLASVEDIQTDNYNWFSSKKLWAKNVGILIKKSPDIVVSHFEPLSEYLCVATVLYYEKPLTVISFHMPPVTDSEQAINQAKEHIKSISEDSVIILGGDFSSAMITTEGHTPNADDFVLKLAKESKLVMVGKEDSVLRGTIFTQITEAGKLRKNYILISQSAYKALKTYSYIRWVPFFEYGIISATSRERAEEKKRFSYDTLKLLDKPSVEVHMITEQGVTSKSVIYKYAPDQLEQKSATDLISEEDKEKFKTTTPSAEDLSRLFKDFVLIHGASKSSHQILTHIGIISKSIMDCGLGGFEVEVLNKPARSMRSVCRLKWNDILLAEEIIETKNHQILLKKVAKSVIAKLSQTCYTVKAKKSFFNKGMRPLMWGDPELDATLRVVDKSLLPTMEDAYKEIDEFLSEDTDGELVFGNGYSRNNLLAITKYVYNKPELASFRFFKSHPEQPADNLAISRKRSPQYIRDMLIKEPQNIRYFLIPPCGLGVDFMEFNQEVITTALKEENEKWAKYSKTEETPKKAETPAQKANQPTRSRNVSRRSLQQNVRPRLSGSTNVSRRSRQQNERSRHSGATRDSHVNSRSREHVRSETLGRRRDSRVSPRSQNLGRRRSPLARRSHPRERPQPLLSVRVEPIERRRSHYDLDQYSEELGGRKRDYDMMTSSRNNSFQNDEYFERSRGERDFMRDLNQLQSDYYYESSGIQRRYDLDRNESYRSDQFYESSLSNKRQRLDDMMEERGFMLSMPDWSNIRPLLIVWPITVRSDLEQRPEAVLSDNFTVQFKTRSVNNQSVTAVFITLTLFNGSAMTYCIAKGSNTRNAARVALELLVKHCTVIKPKSSFFCDGYTPNFLRYKIPCPLYPRTYLILEKVETGYLTSRVIENLVSQFLASCEEEMYFDRDSYSLDEKLAIVEQVPKIAQEKLLIRHLGDQPKLNDRFLCVYKIKPKHQILEEVLKMRGEHPRYVMTINRLPSGIESTF